MPVHVAADRDALAAHASATIAGLLEDRARPRASLGLAGGSSPKATYHQLRWESLNWAMIDLWLSDERWVPPDHEDSNGRMAIDAFIAEVGATLHRPRWSPRLTPADSAAFYEAELRSIIPTGSADVVLLGMGDDGHTASLFPSTDALSERTRWFVENEVPQLDTWRLTTTSGFLRAAANVVVIVAGESKSSVLREVLEGAPNMYPIQLLREATGTVWWLLDNDAASELAATEFETI